MTRSTVLRMALALTGALLSCDRGEPGRIPVADVASVVVSPTALGATTRAFPARISAAGNVDVATRTSGLVRQVAVDVGDRVRVGQLLVEIDGGDVLAGLTAAEAEARLARRYYERIAALERDGAATSQELDEAEARLAGAEAGVREARTRVGYVRLAAPIDGVVTERHVDPGDLIGPGQPALTVASSTDLEVVADLPADEMGSMRPGTTVGVVLPGGGVRLPARVRRVVPALESQSRTFRVEATIEGPGPGTLLPGMYVRMELTRPELETRWIPVDAVVRQGQMSGVYVVENDTLRLRWVRLGETRWDAVELLAGLRGGVHLVRDPGSQLADGSAVARIEIRPWSPAVEPAPDPERGLHVESKSP